MKKPDKDLLDYSSTRQRVFEKSPHIKKIWEDLKSKEADASKPSDEKKKLVPDGITSTPKQS